MPEIFSLNMPARVYDIPIINEELLAKVVEINATREEITLLSERIQNAIELLSQYNGELLTLYIQQNKGLIFTEEKPL
jgi:hypothetical protein